MTKQKMIIHCCLILPLALLVLLTGCPPLDGNGTSGPEAGDQETFMADGLYFNMVYIPAKSLKTGNLDDGTATVVNA